MHASHGLSLFAIRIERIIGILSLLSNLHIPGIVVCLSQQWQMDSEGWGYILSSIERHMCVPIIFTLIIPCFVSFWAIVTIVSKHLLWILFASSYDLNMFPIYVLLYLGNWMQEGFSILSLNYFRWKFWAEVCFPLPTGFISFG